MIPSPPSITVEDNNVGGVLPAAIILLNDQPFTSGTAITASGSYTLSATATDQAGNTSTQTISFTIGAPPAAPIPDALPALTKETTITVTGFAEPGSQLTVNRQPSTVNFTQVVPSTGLFSIQVDLIADTVNILSVTAATSSGAPSPAAIVTITQDSTPPAVVSTHPVEGGTLATTQSIFIEFSESLNTTDPIWETVPSGDSGPPIRVLDNLNQPVPGRLTFSASGKSVTFFPNNLLSPDSDYGLIIDSAITDLAGHNLPQTVAINFHTLQASGIKRPPAVVLDPQPPANTQENAITLTGHIPQPSAFSLQPPPLIHVLGGLQSVETSVQPDGSFSIGVPLLLDEINNLVIYAVVDDVESEVVTATIRHNSHPPGIRILTPQQDLEYQNPSLTVMGVIDSPEFVDIDSIRVEGEEVGLFGNSFARQVIFDTSGPKTVTATCQLLDGTPVTDTITFSCVSEPEGVDTKPPIVKIIFPEAGFTANRIFVEIMGTVEEGVALSSVTCEGVHAHAMLGNIFLVYCELKIQGENQVTIIARDKQGLVGQDSVTIFLDDEAPPLPTASETPAKTNKRIFEVTGTAGSGETVIIRGGLTTVRTGGRREWQL